MLKWGLIAGALCVALPAFGVHAAECGSTENRAGCVGPNGAAGYNKNTGQLRTAKPYHPTNEVAPGRHVEGWRGNSATKGAQPGCGFVNGKRVCE